MKELQKITSDEKVLTFMSKLP